MKRLLLALSFVVCLPVLAKSVPFDEKMGTAIILRFGYKDDVRGCERDKRAPAFIPISAFYDTDNLYLNSCYSVENTAVVVKDKWGNVMYEADVELLTDKEIVLPLNVGEGNYTLEITYGSICLSGDFEI